MTDTLDILPYAGLCMTTRAVVEGRTPVKWMAREWPMNPQDNGWRIFGLSDTDEVLADPENSVIAPYSVLCSIEPSLIFIFDFPVGSELQIVRDSAGTHIVHNESGIEVPPEDFYVPGAPYRDWGDRTARFRG